MRCGGAADNYLKKPEAADATKPEHTDTYMGKGEWQHQKKEAGIIPWNADSKLVVSFSDN